MKFFIKFNFIHKLPNNLLLYRAQAIISIEWQCAHTYPLIHNDTVIHGPSPRCNYLAHFLAARKIELYTRTTMQKRNSAAADYWATSVLRHPTPLSWLSKCIKNSPTYYARALARPAVTLSLSPCRSPCNFLLKSAPRETETRAQRTYTYLISARVRATGRLPYDLHISAWRYGAATSRSCK